ncbi:MAG: bifunctional phosphopantothenoylcysteine decarboxylase/phosphopantothenate--cysteine ligase CoaBC [Acidimicrobiales bacterium]
MRPSAGSALSGSGLAGHKVLLGVTGGIAAYKAVEVCRRLVDAGAWVTPVLTVAATRFVGEATFSALASEPVRTSLWDGPLWDGPEGIAHTALARSADLVVVAPATASFLARFAAGLADDLLGATLLATRAPVLLAPAMHTEMWEHLATLHNVEVLRGRGVHLVGPGAGNLAGGDQGLGRLAEPCDIVEAAASLLALARDLSGVKVLVSAGGTREPLDPVRFIGNRSSGKQGYLLAAEALRRGAEVTLVTAADRPAPGGVQVVRVETAAEMHEAVMGLAGACEVVVLAAAVADWRPSSVSAQKASRTGEPPEVVLEAVPDISAAVAAQRSPGQLMVGFAAEVLGRGSGEAEGGPAELSRRAMAKLRAKGLDLVVANDVSADGIGFDHDTNAVTIVAADGAVVEVALADKAQVARAVLDEVVARLAQPAR